MISRETLLRESSATRFRMEPLEKLHLLVDLLETLRSHPFLKDRIALKGGTALNLFWFDVPRLSVDIDLNYIGSADRESMMAERPKIEQAVRAVCGRLQFRVARTPSDHAGGEWRLKYDSVIGQSGTLELDMTFMFRTPILLSFSTPRHPFTDPDLYALMQSLLSLDETRQAPLLNESLRSRSRFRSAICLYRFPD